MILANPGCGSFCPVDLETRDNPGSMKLRFMNGDETNISHKMYSHTIKICILGTMCKHLMPHLNILSRCTVGVLKMFLDNSVSAENVHVYITSPVTRKGECVTFKFFPFRHVCFWYLSCCLDNV